jgi:hypothetical protein
MLEEFREYCEDNNQALPAPLESVPPVPELSFWSPADPALENEAPRALRLAVRFRWIILQRVVYDIRYQLMERRQFSERFARLATREAEMGDVPDLRVALELARAWLSGAEPDELPKERRILV